ncbi:MAG: hypothetical protein K5Q00_02670, partial [Gammaproteobacteria bacterium]|nr:hypothetical protein [Gammaproteobacteria bacterium]
MQRIAIYVIFILGLVSAMSAIAGIQPGAITIAPNQYSTQLSQLQLVCGVPQQAYPDQCKNSVGATIAAAGTSFDLAALQNAFYPGNDKCPITAANCTLQGTLSGNVVPLVDLTLNQLGKWSDGSAGLAWGVQLSNVQPHQGSNALVTNSS